MLFVGLVYMALILIVIKRQGWSFTYQHLANLAFCLKLIFIGGILTICTIRRTFFLNLTTNEELLNNNYKYLKNQNGNYFNRFDKGFWGNVKDYFSTSVFHISNQLNSKSNYTYKRLHNEY